MGISTYLHQWQEEKATCVEDHWRVDIRLRMRSRQRKKRSRSRRVSGKERILDLLKFFDLVIILSFFPIKREEAKPRAKCVSLPIV